MGVAFEIKNGIDNVLENAWTRDRALLGHMTHEEDGDACLLGKSRQLRGTLSDLRNAPRCRLERLGVNGLDRVDHDNVRSLGANRADDSLELDFGQKLDGRVDQPEALRAQRDLIGGFLAGDVQSPARNADRGHGLQQQRRLADAGIASEQDHATGNKATAKDPVEFLDAGRHARIIAGVDAG